jgi:phosphatidate cytidylyltransferase
MKIQTGRNLPKATAVGLLLIGLVIGTLFLFKYSFVILALVALLLANFEIIKQFNLKLKIDISNILVSLFVVIIVLISLIYGFTFFLLTYLFIVFLITLLSIFSKNRKNYFFSTLSIFTYIGVFGSFAMLMLRPEDGPQRVFVFIAITALSDTGGYLAGIIFGRHKIVPSISPKKSYEGLLGSILLSVLFSIFIARKFLEINMIQAVILGLVLAVIGTCGDLFESIVKRKLGIKDFSTLLPGHGGIADRLDSLAFNAFASFGLFALFLGVN